MVAAMVFSSSLFLLLFVPLFFGVYWLLPYRFKNGWALLASVLFYTWGAPLFVFVLIASVAMDYLLVRQFENPAWRRPALWLALIGNVGLLAYFKYANFFVDNVNSILRASGLERVGWTEILLPIGISFFTFQKISYVVDVYRQLKRPLKRYSDHLLYVILFPQLIAGPIVRYSDIADQLANRREAINAENRLLGLFRFAVGLGKKVLIANVLGAEADRIFELEPQLLGTSQAWYGALCYTFQIYFDFSGYSDMAIGLGRMMGFSFPENFRSPYIAKSITEFWRRWHITLSTWMRDYLYIPLGGNRVKKGRLYFNLWFVFLLSGLWHGAAWTFIFWGAYHGLFLVLERSLLKKVYASLPGVLNMLITFVIVVVGWVFFRSETFGQARLFLQKMFAFSGGGPDIPAQVMLTGGVAILFSFVGYSKKVEDWQESLWVQPPGKLRTLAFALISLLLLVLSIGSISASGFNPFIYFRF